jgi:hypothetical protein
MAETLSDLAKPVMAWVDKQHIRKRPAVAGDNFSKSLFDKSIQRPDPPAVEISALQRKVLS